jgi:predicted enzyme involved in methoxymalonyl-ACP biosynthesis
MIAVAIGRRRGDGDFVIDTWLMSCRVLGRQVEHATLAVIAQEARRLGATRLLGEYIPTPKNGLVAEHYPKLGFAIVEQRADGGHLAALELGDFKPIATFIRIEKDEAANNDGS